MALNEEEKKINFAINNANVYKVKHKIDFVNCDFEFFKSSKDKFDVLFLCPGYEVKFNNNFDKMEKFCIFSNFKCDIKKMIENAFSITDNLLIILPKNCEIAEISLLINNYYQKNNM